MPSPRKPKLTPELIERVTGALQMGADWVLAAGVAKMSRKGLQEYGAKHPDVLAQWNEARERADDIIVKTLYDRARGGDTTAMIFWLKNRKPTEWRDRREIVGDPKAPVTLMWLDDPEPADGAT